MTRGYTPEQHRIFRDLIDEVPGRLITFPRYPGPRPRGRITLPSGAVVSAPPAAGTGLPRVVLWPFVIRESGLSIAATVVSPNIPGPAVIDRIWLQIQSAAGNPHTAFNLYIADDGSGGGNNQALTPIPPGIPIWETTNLAHEGGETTQVGGGMDLSLSTTTVFDIERGLGYPVTLGSFFLKARVSQSSAGATVVNGSVRVLAGLTLEQLRDFI